MKKEAEATKTFVEHLAEAGLDAFNTFGKAVKDLGADLVDDRTPFETLTAAAVGLERAHGAFIKGALAAVRKAVDVDRRGVKRDTEVREPKFELYRMNTLTITGTASLAALGPLLDGSGFAPATLKAANKRSCGIVQLYFNDVSNGYYGPCKEMLLTVVAAPADTPIELPWRHPDNPYSVLAPAFEASPVLFAPMMLVDGPREDIEFGRDVLGLNKIKKDMGNVHVGKDGAFLSIEGVVRGEVRPNLEEADGALERLAAALGRTPKEILRTPSPDLYRIVARKGPRDRDVKRWAWALDKSSLPRMQPIGDGALTFLRDSEMGTMILDAKFAPRIATWTFGVDAHLEWPIAGA